MKEFFLTLIAAYVVLTIAYSIIDVFDARAHLKKQRPQPRQPQNLKNKIKINGQN